MNFIPASKFGISHKKKSRSMQILWQKLVRHSIHALCVRLRLSSNTVRYIMSKLSRFQGYKRWRRRDSILANQDKLVNSLTINNRGKKSYRYEARRADVSESSHDDDPQCSGFYIYFTPAFDISSEVFAFSTHHHYFFISLQSHWSVDTRERKFQSEWDELRSALEFTIF